jgi:hypothetical protein
MLRKIAVALLATFLAAPQAAQATLVNYRFTLTVDDIEDCDPSTTYLSFGCDVAPGEVFVGRFGIDQDLLGSLDGLYDVPFESLFLRTGAVVWDHGNLPGDCDSIDPNCLEVYRNIAGPSYFTASGTGFYVQDGEIAGFAGGFVGPSDAWFIDFDYVFGLGAAQFGALAAGGEYMHGTYSIQRVPLPSSFSLLIFGAISVAFCRRRFLGSHTQWAARARGG